MKSGGIAMVVDEKNIDQVIPVLTKGFAAQLELEL